MGIGGRDNDNIKIRIKIRIKNKNFCDYSILKRSI